MRRQTVSTILMLGWMASAVPGASAQPMEYKLGPGDRLRVTLSDWPAGGGEIQTRLDGVFAVDSAGHLSLPLIGMVTAQGRATPELAQAISETFQTRVGTFTKPIASIEVVEHRPFYVVGAVEKPGSYPYRPGMTALHALSLAGGLFRRPDVDTARLEREAIAASGSRALQSLSRDAALLRRTRLEAELAGESKLAWPAELAERKTDPQLMRLMRDETALLEQRQESLKAAIDTQLRLKALGERQSASLAALSAAVDRQMAVAKRELDEQMDLVNKGLSRRPLLFPIEARLADTEAKRRQLEADILKNGQDIARAEHLASELRSNRRAEIMAQLKEVREAVQQAEQRIANDGLLADQSGAEVMRQSGEASTIYSILRTENRVLVERPATETSEIEPGDIIRIVVPTQARQAVATGNAAAPAPAAAEVAAPAPAAPAPRAAAEPAGARVVAAGQRPKGN